MKRLPRPQWKEEVRQLTSQLARDVAALLADIERRLGSLEKDLAEDPPNLERLKTHRDTVQQTLALAHACVALTDLLRRRG